MSPRDGLFDVGNFGIAEEGLHQHAILLNCGHRAGDCGAERLAVVQRDAPEHRLQMSPDMLIGVHVGCVARQVVDGEPILLQFKEAPRGSRDMGRVLVEYEDNVPANVAEQGLEELDEQRGVEVLVEAAEPQPAARADERDDVDASARERHANSGALPARPPRRGDGPIFAHPGLVPEEDGRLLALRLAHDGRELLARPSPAGQVIALKGAALGLLRRQPKTPEQASDTRLVQDDSELPLDERQDDREGPQSGAEGELERILADDDALELLLLSLGELRLPHGCLRAGEPVGAETSVGVNPLPQRTRSDLEASGHVNLLLASHDPADGEPTHLFERGVVEASGIPVGGHFHAS